MNYPNLNAYYASTGTALPSLSDRAGIYASKGLGDAGSYVGTSAQNSRLLGALTGPGGAPLPSPTSTPASGGVFGSPTPSTPTDPYAEAGNVGPNLAEYYQGQLNSLGVPDLQKTVQTFKDQAGQVNSQLNNLTEDINARTKGSLTSQAQADHMNTVEGGVLRNQLAKLGTAAQPATDALTSALNTANQMTGFFSQDKQQQLSVIMDKIHRGQALTDQETARANDLAKLAVQHQYALSESASASKNNSLDINSALQQWMQQFGGAGTSNGQNTLQSLFPGYTVTPKATPGSPPSPSASSIAPPASPSGPAWYNLNSAIKNLPQNFMSLFGQ